MNARKPLIDQAGEVREVTADDMMHLRPPKFDKIRRKHLICKDPVSEIAITKPESLLFSLQASAPPVQ